MDVSPAGVEAAGATRGEVVDECAALAPSLTTAPSAPSSREGGPGPPLPLSRPPLLPRLASGVRGVGEGDGGGGARARARGLAWCRRRARARVDVGGFYGVRERKAGVGYLSRVDAGAAVG